MGIWGLAGQAKLRPQVPLLALMHRWVRAVPPAPVLCQLSPEAGSYNWESGDRRLHPGVRRSSLPASSSSVI